MSVDKELIVKSVAKHGAEVAKMVFPKIPSQAIETLITVGIRHKLDDPKYSQFLEFLFDSEGNLPSPQEFWEVAGSILDEKPLSFQIFNQRVTLNGKDIEQVKQIFNNLKQRNNGA